MKPSTAANAKGERPPKFSNRMPPKKGPRTRAAPTTSYFGSVSTGSSAPINRSMFGFESAALPWIKILESWHPGCYTKKWTFIPPNMTSISIYPTSLHFSSLALYAGVLLRTGQPPPRVLGPQGLHPWKLEGILGWEPDKTSFTPVLQTSISARHVSLHPSFAKRNYFTSNIFEWSSPDTLFWHSFWHTIRKYVWHLYSDSLSDIISRHHILRLSIWHPFWHLSWQSLTSIFSILSVWHSI